MDLAPVQIGRRAALAGALDAVRSFRTLTELLRDGAFSVTPEESRAVAAEIAAADALIRGLNDLLSEAAGGTEHPDLFTSAAA